MPDSESADQQRKFSPLLILIVIFVGVGVVAAIGLIVGNNSTNPAEESGVAVEVQAPVSTSSLINQPAPDFERPNLDGELVRISDYQGQLVFLNFWATWCVPCREEMPTFQEFVTSQPDDGPVILAVNDAEAPEKIREFLDEVRAQDVPVLIDTDSAQQQTYAIQIMPTTYIIDPDGIIRAVKFGEVTLEDLDGYIEAFG